MTPRDIRFGRQGGRIVDADTGPTMDELREQYADSWPTTDEGIAEEAVTLFDEISQSVEDPALENSLTEGD